MADDAPGSALPPLFDADRGLRELARHRGRRDPLTRVQVQFGDALAEYVNRHFSAEEVETAGRALLIAASCAGGLVEKGVDRPESILNIIGFAAARMVADGRAWAEAGQEGAVAESRHPVAELPAVTVKQPWTNAIAYGDKRVENRTWALPARLVATRIAIHAGKQRDLDCRLPEGCAWPEVPAMTFGAVLAVATVTGSCVPWECDGSCSPWAVRGQDHWHLSDVRALPVPVPCKGALGVWKLPGDVEKAVREQLEAKHG